MDEPHNVCWAFPEDGPFNGILFEDMTMDASLNIAEIPYEDGSIRFRIVNEPVEKYWNALQSVSRSVEFILGR
jgi:hypothetical protein